MRTTKKEVELLDLQLLTTVIYIGSLILSSFLTYNDRQALLKETTIFSDKQARNYSLFNRFFVLVLTLSYLYISYENRKIAKQKGEKLDSFNLQVIASELSTLATIIVLYVVIQSSGESYSIISGIENPSL